MEMGDWHRGMIKSGSETVVDCIWRLCNIAFESVVVPKYWGSAMIVPLCKGNEEKREFS